MFTLLMYVYTYVRVAIKTHQNLVAYNNIFKEETSHIAYMCKLLPTHEY